MPIALTTSIPTSCCASYRCSPLRELREAEDRRSSLQPLELGSRPRCPAAPRSSTSAQQAESDTDLVERLRTNDAPVRRPRPVRPPGPQTSTPSSGR
jgi:hypothetical protein